MLCREVHGALDASTDSGASRGDAERQLLGTLAQLIGWHHLVDKPTWWGALGGDRLAGQQDLHGDARRHQPEQGCRPGRPAAGFDLGLTAKVACS